MTLPILEETIPSIFQKPHLSYSRINRYLTCPEQYRLYYLENYRPKQPPASLIFGKVIHRAIARFFQTGCDLKNTFQSEWHECKNANLRYSFRDTWDSLNEKGINLLGKFLDERMVRFPKILAVEKEFELSIPGLNLPFVGIIDLIVETEGKITIVDFKTSSSTY